MSEEIEFFKVAFAASHGSQEQDIKKFFSQNGKFEVFSRTSEGSFDLTTHSERMRDVCPERAKSISSELVHP